MENNYTEPPFSGKYNSFYEKGQYKCSNCGNILFKSDTKFDSGSGWPSFWDKATEDSIAFHEDTSHGMIRTEVTCKKCGAHLGHIFDDGPKPTGQRYCINSYSLNFENKDLILTEKRNPASANIDNLSAREVLEVINNEDQKVALAVKEALDDIAKAVDIIAEAFSKDGSLLYFGAGTSGRLGVLDASECPPTFSAPADMVRGYIAGGDEALRFSIEGAEDSFEGGEQDLIKSKTGGHDVVVGISASGNAAYIEGVLSKAQSMGLKTIAIACNKDAKSKQHADVFICAEVGPEVITGSTRLKAGTAQKMILNMLTTGSMIKIGKTYKNYMIDLNPSNEKLRDRATRILSEVAEISYDEAKKLLEQHNWHLREALKSL